MADEQQPNTPTESIEPKTPASKKLNLRSKKLLGLPLFAVIAIAVVILLGGSAGAYFGIIVPNQPDNIWHSALKNTANGYDKLTKLSEKNKDVKGAKLKGTFKFEAADVKGDGSFDTKTYDKDSETSFDVGAKGARIKAQVLSHAAKSGENPDIYIKATGLDGLGQILGGSDSSQLSSLFESIEDQWYVVDHTMFDQAEQSFSSSGLPKDLTYEDVLAIQQAVGRVNRDYIFTTDESKAVLQMQQKVGKEKLDDRNTYHFKVGYNKEHFKAYVSALKDELKKTKLKDAVEGDSFKDMEKSIDELDGKAQADVWVDLRTKLIRKVRFTPADKPDSHIDIALNYNGGDIYPLVVNFEGKSKDSSGHVTISLSYNAKNNNAKLNVDVNIDSGEQGKVTASLDATGEPSGDKIDFKVPEGVQSITQLLGGSLGGGAPGLDESEIPAELLNSL